MSVGTRALPRQRRAARRAGIYDLRTTPSLPIAVEPAWIAAVSAQRVLEWALLLVTAAMPLVNDAWTFESFELPKQVVMHIAVHLALALAAAITLLRLPDFAAKFGTSSSDAARAWASRAMRWPPAIVGAGVVLAWSIVTAMSVAPTVSFWGTWPRWAGWWQQVHLVLLFLIAASAVTNLTRARRLGFTVASSIAVASAYALYQKFAQAINRPHSTFGNPNFLSDYIALSLPLTVAAGVGSRSPQARAFWVIAALLQIGAAMVTETRGVWLALAAGLPFLLILLVWQRGGPWKKLALGLALMGVLSVGALYVFRVQLRGVPLIGRAASIMEARDESAVSRLVVWNTARQLWLDSPVFGHGPDSMSAVAGRRLPPSNQAILSESFQELFDRAHNTTLDGLAATGLVGMLSLLGAAGLVVWSSIRLLVRRPSASEDAAVDSPAALAGHPLTAGLAAGMATYFVAQQFSIESAGASSLAWTLAGAIAGLARGLGHSADKYPVIGITGGNRPSRLEARGGPPAWAVGAACISVLLIGVTSVWWETRQINASAEFKRANALARAERSAEASTAYERSVQLWPFERRYWLELAFAQRHNARVLTDQAATRKWLLDSVTNADRSIAIDPENPLYLSKWADVVGEAGQRLNDPVLSDKALKGHEKAVKIAPDRWVLWSDAGLTYLRLNRPQQARDALARTVELYDRDWVQFARYGDALAAVNDRSAARLAYHQALSMLQNQKQDHQGVRDALARLGPE